MAEQEYYQELVEQFKLLGYKGELISKMADLAFLRWKNRLNRKSKYAPEDLPELVVTPKSVTMGKITTDTTPGAPNPELDTETEKELGKGVNYDAEDANRYLVMRDALRAGNVPAAAVAAPIIATQVVPLAVELAADYAGSGIKDAVLQYGDKAAESVTNFVKTNKYANPIYNNTIHPVVKGFEAMLPGTEAFSTLPTASKVVGAVSTTAMDAAALSKMTTDHSTEAIADGVMTAMPYMGAIRQAPRVANATNRARQAVINGANTVIDRIHSLNGVPDDFTRLTGDGAATVNYWLLRYNLNPEETARIINPYLEENGLPPIDVLHRQVSSRQRINNSASSNSPIQNLYRTIGNATEVSPNTGVYEGYLTPAVRDAKNNVVSNGTGIRYRFTPDRNAADPNIGTMQITENGRSVGNSFTVDLREIPTGNIQYRLGPSPQALNLGYQRGLIQGIGENDDVLNYLKNLLQLAPNRNATLRLTVLSLDDFLSSNNSYNRILNGSGPLTKREVDILHQVIDSFENQLYDLVRRRVMDSRTAQERLELLTLKIKDIENLRNYDFTTFLPEDILRHVHKPEFSNLNDDIVSNYTSSIDFFNTVKNKHGIDLNNFGVHDLYFPGGADHSTLFIESFGLPFYQSLLNYKIKSGAILSDNDLINFGALTWNNPRLRDLSVQQLVSRGIIQPNTPELQLATFFNQNSTALHLARVGLIPNSKKHSRTATSVFNLAEAEAEKKEFLKMAQLPGGYYDIHCVSPHSFLMELTAAKRKLRHGEKSVVIPKDSNGNFLTFRLNLCSLFDNYDLELHNYKHDLERVYSNPRTPIPEYLLEKINQIGKDRLINMFASEYINQGMDRNHAILKALYEDERNPTSRAKFIKEYLRGINVDGKDLSDFVRVENGRVYVPNIQFRFKKGGKLNYLNYI